MAKKHSFTSNYNDCLKGFPIVQLASYKVLHEGLLGTLGKIGAAGLGAYGLYNYGGDVANAIGNFGREHGMDWLGDAGDKAAEMHQNAVQGIKGSSFGQFTGLGNERDQWMYTHKGLLDKNFDDRIENLQNQYNQGQMSKNDFQNQLSKLQSERHDQTSWKSLGDKYDRINGNSGASNTAPAPQPAPATPKSAQPAQPSVEKTPTSQQAAGNQNAQPAQPAAPKSTGSSSTGAQSAATTPKPPQPEQPAPPGNNGQDDVDNKTAVAMQDQLRYDGTYIPSGGVGSGGPGTDGGNGQAVPSSFAQDSRHPVGAKPVQVSPTPQNPTSSSQPSSDKTKSTADLLADMSDEWNKSQGSNTATTSQNNSTSPTMKFPAPANATGVNNTVNNTMGGNPRTTPSPFPSTSSNSDQPSVLGQVGRNVGVGVLTQATSRALNRAMSPKPSTPNFVDTNTKRQPGSTNTKAFV